MIATFRIPSRVPLAISAASPFDSGTGQEGRCRENKITGVMPAWGEDITFFVQIAFQRATLIVLLVHLAYCLLLYS
jgi:hypothetical protein